MYVKAENINLKEIESIQCLSNLGKNEGMERYTQVELDKTMFNIL